MVGGGRSGGEVRGLPTRLQRDGDSAPLTCIVSAHIAILPQRSENFELASSAAAERREMGSACSTHETAICSGNNGHST